MGKRSSKHQLMRYNQNNFNEGNIGCIQLAPWIRTHRTWLRGDHAPWQSINSQCLVDPAVFTNFISHRIKFILPRRAAALQQLPSASGVSRKRPPFHVYLVQSDGFRTNDLPSSYLPITNQQFPRRVSRAFPTKSSSIFPSLFTQPLSPACL